MTQHCYVVPSAAGLKPAHPVAHVTPVRHVGQPMHAHRVHAAVPKVAGTPAGTPTCSAPVGAMRALRNLGALPAAGLVAGGMALGASGAALSNRIAPARAPMVDAGGAGSSAFAAPVGSSYRLASVSTTVPATVTDLGTDGVTSALAAALPSAIMADATTPAVTRQLAVPTRRFVSVGTPNIPTPLDDTPVGSTPTTPSDAPADKPVSVPEPALTGWASFALAGLGAWWARRRRGQEAVRPG